MNQNNNNANHGLVDSKNRKHSPGASNPHSRAMRQLETLLRHTRNNRLAQKYPRPVIAVAIPVSNEVERIARCIEALANQRDLSGCLLARGLVRVVLLTNGCTDGSYDLIERHMEHWRIAISAYDISLPRIRQNAGSARHMANHVALDLLPKSGLLFMTDADSCAPPQWIASYGALLRSGYDAVAGLVNLHPDDCAEILLPLHQRIALEERYTEMLDELDAFIDPVVHDPWPRHYNASGANIAMRVDAIRGVDDFPQIACGEDRLLIRRLEAQGRRVRHDRQLRVLTSGRLVGRAAGGMADTLRHRLKTPDTPCDPRLEALDSAYARASLRREMRDLWKADEHNLASASPWADYLGVTVSNVQDVFHAKTFESAWHCLEESAPALERRPISPCQLPEEIQKAERLLRCLKAGGTRGAIDIPLEMTA